MIAACISDHDIIALRTKYEHLLQLRLEHECDPNRCSREAMQRLALEYPGALRELDTLPTEEIKSRITLLQRVIEKREDAPQWVLYFIRYHHHMRIALRIKRALADGNVIDAIDPDLRNQVHRPPQGRLNRLVFQKLAAEFSADPAHIERTLFR